MYVHDIYDADRSSMSSHTILFNDLQEAAGRIVHEFTGEDVREVTRLRIGVMTHKFTVEAGATSYIVRFYPPHREHVVLYEPDIIRRCHALGARVPQVLGDSRSGPGALLSYMVYKKIPGHRMSKCLSRLSPPQRCALAGSLASEFALLRRITVTGYGDLLDGGTARFPTWQVFLESSLCEGMRAVESLRLLDARHITLLKTVSRRLHDLIGMVPSCLNWGDVSTDNVIVDSDGNLAGLLDFEGAIFGDPLLTLGYAMAFYGRSPVVEDLAQAWPDVNAGGWRRAELYAVLRGLRLAPHYANPFLPSGERRSPLKDVVVGMEPSLESLASL